MILNENVLNLLGVTGKFVNFDAVLGSKLVPKNLVVLKRIYDWRNGLNATNYLETLCAFLQLNEGCVLYPYYCSAGALTVGVGLVIRFPKIKNFSSLGCSAFSSIGKNLREYETDIDDFIKNSTEIITTEEADALLRFVISKNTECLCRIFPFFLELPLEVQLSFQSIFYNSPGFFNDSLRQVLSEYYKNSCLQNREKILLKMIEFKNYDGMIYKNGLQNRRLRELFMASCYEIDQKILKSFFC